MITEVLEISSLPLMDLRGLSAYPHGIRGSFSRIASLQNTAEYGRRSLGSDVNQKASC